MEGGKTALKSIVLKIGEVAGISYVSVLLFKSSVAVREGSMLKITMKSIKLHRDK